MPPVRTVLPASPRSLCAGVERAIATVERLLDDCDGPVYVRKQIVPDTHVIADLTARGAVFVDELTDVPHGATVVFSARGVAPQVWHEAARRQLDVVDTTCPLMAKLPAEVPEREVARETVRFLVPAAAHPAHEQEPGEAGVPGPGGVGSVITSASVVHRLGGIPFIDLGMWTDLI